MKTIIAVLAVLLLAVSSAQAATVLMDEDFNSLPEHVDLDTVPGWTNNLGSGVGPLFTTYRDIDPVDVGRGIHKYEWEYLWSDYSYAIDPHDALGPGEFYRFDSFWHVIDGPVNQLACSLTRLMFSDGRQIHLYFDPNEDITQEIYAETEPDGLFERNRISNNRIYPGVEGDLRLRLDVGPDGVLAYYDAGGGWIQQGQALASDDARFSFTGGIASVRVELFSFTNLDWPQADSFSLTVESSAPTPEPATICLLALAGTVLLAGRRR